MAQLRQMPGSQSAAKDIVSRNRILIGDLAVNEYNRYRDISQHVSHAALLRAVDQKNSINLAAYRVSHLRQFSLRTPFRDAEEGLKAAFPQLVFHDSGYLTKEWRRDIRDHYADRIGLSQPQTPSAEIDSVIQRGNRLFNILGGRGRKRRGLVKIM